MSLFVYIYAARNASFSRQDKILKVLIPELGAQRAGCIAAQLGNLVFCNVKTLAANAPYDCRLLL